MTPALSKNIAIVGSGFLGLTLALRLAEAGNQVTIFESAAEIGGLAGAWKIGDVVWDKHYHVTLASDSFARRIVEEIGLGKEFKWVETKTGFYTGGKLVSMSNSVEFLKFPPLDFISKIRLGATIFYASKMKDWRALEKIPVETWLTKLSGKKTFDKIWKPLLKAKLGEAYKQTSAAFIWATIQRMYAARNSGLKKEMFGYVKGGGYARVLKRFGEHLREKGVEIRLNSAVETVEKLADGKVKISIADEAANAGKFSKEDRVNFFLNLYKTSVKPNGNSLKDFLALEFDDVILTCPSSAAAKICPQLTDEERRKHEAIKYQGIICASLLMRNSISAFYVTNITDEVPFTGVIEMSALVDKSELNGNALVYLPKYVAPDDALFEKSDEEIEKIFVAALEKMYPQFRREDVSAVRVSRVREVFPLPVLNYSSKLPPVKTSLENVYVVNSAQITNGTLNVNETVQLAERFFSENFSNKLQKAPAKAAAKSA